MKARFSALLVTWFGAGRSPVSSGTVGSLAALPFAYVIQSLLGSYALLAASIAVFLLGCAASAVYLREYPGKDDPKEIVIDEVAGQFLTLCLFPATWRGYAVGFVLFRLFDIVKPWPICVADRRIGGALGVMLDDMLAGLYVMLIFVCCACFGLGYDLRVVMQYLAGL